MNANKNFIVTFHFEGAEVQLIRVSAQNDAQAEAAAKKHVERFAEADDDGEIPELYIDAVLEEATILTITA